MTDPERHRTVSGRGRAAFEVRGSRFVGHAAPARTVEGAEAVVGEVRGDHPDATHTVPAYRVREGGLVREHADDDGEPSGSAGKPALTVLRRREVEDVACVVTRYYGGTNLGVGGLARAYARGVKEALREADVVEAAPRERLCVCVGYDDSGTVRGILESEGLKVEAEYGTDVSFEAWAPAPRAEEIRDRIRSATSGRADVG